MPCPALRAVCAKYVQRILLVALWRSAGRIIRLFPAAGCWCALGVLDIGLGAVEVLELLHYGSVDVEFCLPSQDYGDLGTMESP